MNRSRIGVFPGRALGERRRLFSVLEQAYAVRFEPREIGAFEGVEAALIFGEESSSIQADSAPTPSLRFGHDSAGDAQQGPAVIEFSEDDSLPRPLRGQVLAENRAGFRPLPPPRKGDAILGTWDRHPVWIARGSSHSVASAPRELREGEILRDHLAVGRFFSLLPLVHFVRSVVPAQELWDEPPLRAAILIDDPNLHATRYGYISYREAVRQTREHGYHLAFATIPIDSWFANRGAIRIFKENPDRLSLLIHGNDHIHRELAVGRSDEASLALLAQAIRRIERLERRTGIPVSRVIAPPHGACSEETLRAMRKTELEAICISRPHPWLDRPPSDRPLTGWRAGDWVAGGIPVISRYSLGNRPEEAVLRAFLHHPLILYGHHQEAASGMRSFADAARRINGLGSITWCSLAKAARSNYALRREGKRLRVRLYARSIELAIPEGVDELMLQISDPPSDIRSMEVLLKNGQRETSLPWENTTAPLGPIPVANLRSTRITLVDRESVDCRSIPSPPFHPWPYLRRLLTESRDRLRPRIRR